MGDNTPWVIASNMGDDASNNTHCRMVKRSDTTFDFEIFGALAYKLTRIVGKFPLS
jgi:hypothetical protein